MCKKMLAECPTIKFNYKFNIYVVYQQMHARMLHRFKYSFNAQIWNILNSLITTYV